MRDTGPRKGWAMGGGSRGVGDGDGDGGDGGGGGGEEGGGGGGDAVFTGTGGSSSMDLPRMSPPSISASVKGKFERYKGLQSSHH